MLKLRPRRPVQQYSNAEKLRAMATKGIEQRHPFLLYKSVILIVVDYGLGLTTLSQSNLLKFDRVQNEAMRVILVQQKMYLMTSGGSSRKGKLEQVKVYLNTIQNPTYPVHGAIKEEKGCRLARDKSWIGQAEQSIQHVCGTT